MPTRRHLLLPLLVGPALGAYAVEIEPLVRPRITRYHLLPSSWPADLRLSVAIVADLHACEPWMDIPRIEGIVRATNALGADVVALLGDYVAGHRKITAVVPNEEWARALAGLHAPLGVYAILGNHDWWDDKVAQGRGCGPTAAGLALEEAGIAVLENESIRLAKSGARFWLAGMGDQQALQDYRPGRTRLRGVDDIETTLNMVTDDAPVILLAHEPDIFPRVPQRVAVTLAGHTHGGQIRIFGCAPYAPSLLSRIYSYGHFFEEERHLVVSGGLGCSWWPIRFGIPPEIVLVEIGATVPSDTRIDWKPSLTFRGAG
jgi:uncharacterized protein